MIGGLQGEFRDLDIKYLKQKSQNVGRKYREASGEIPQQEGYEISQQKDNIFEPKVDFATVQNSSFSLEWSASNGCNSFISTPNHVPFEALDCWLPELLNDIYHA